MKRKVEIGVHEMECIEKYIEWCFKNPSPCIVRKCESDEVCCCGCNTHDIWKDRSHKQYDKLPAEYQETYEFLVKIGYVDKLMEKMKVDKDIQDLLAKQTVLCGEINRIQHLEGIEINNSGH